MERKKQQTWDLKNIKSKLGLWPSERYPKGRAERAQGTPRREKTYWFRKGGR